MPLLLFCAPVRGGQLLCRSSRLSGETPRCHILRAPSSRCSSVVIVANQFHEGVSGRHVCSNDNGVGALEKGHTGHGRWSGGDGDRSGVPWSSGALQIYGESSVGEINQRVGGAN